MTKPNFRTRVFRVRLRLERFVQILFNLEGLRLSDRAINNAHVLPGGQPVIKMKGEDYADE